MSTTDLFLVAVVAVVLLVAVVYLFRKPTPTYRTNLPSGNNGYGQHRKQADGHGGGNPKASRGF